MMKHIDVIALVLCFLLVATGWWYFWVSPRDEALLDIAECMNGDMSPESYDRCVQQWKQQNIMESHQGGTR